MCDRFYGGGTLCPLPPPVAALKRPILNRVNKQNDYSEENTCVTSFAPPVFNRLRLILNRKRTCGNESHEKQTKHIHASAADFVVEWCVQILKREGSICLSSFYGQLLDY